MKFLRRIWGTLRWDEDVFFEIGMDRKAIWQAFGLILLVSLLSSLWWVLQSNAPILLQLSLTASGLAAWLIFAGWVGFLDMLLKGGGMSRAEIMRVGGFAALPLVFLSIPYAGWLSVIWFWRIMYAALRSLSPSPKSPAAVCSPRIT